MSKWRPEGWYNPNLHHEHLNKKQCPHCLYEAGADAMLEALRKKSDRAGKNLTKEQWLAVWGTKAEGSGCIVFIPDDEA